MMKSAKQNYNSPTRETMEPLTTKTFWNNKILPLIKGVIAFLVVTLSLFHVFFDAKVPGVSEVMQEHKEVVQNRNNTLKENLSLLKNNQISNENYIKIVEITLANSQERLDFLKNEKKVRARAFSFRGRSSFHFWIFVFGLVTALFFFSCKSLHDDFSRGSTFKFHFVSLTGILVSGFWCIHLIFLTQKDFQQNKYVLALVIATSLFAAFTYFLIKYYTYKDDIIYKQLSFLERIRASHYPKIAKKAKYAEKVGLVAKSDLDNDIDEFQEDLRDVVNNI